MANQQQLDLLKQEVATAWNMWRAAHPGTAIELNGVDLSEANLGEVNLAGADLSFANLRGADVNHAYLIRALLVRSKLSVVELDGDDLLFAVLCEAELCVGIL